MSLSGKKFTYIPKNFVERGTAKKDTAYYKTKKTPTTLWQESVTENKIILTEDSPNDLFQAIRREKDAYYKIQKTLTTLRQESVTENKIILTKDLLEKAKALQKEGEQTLYNIRELYKKIPKKQKYSLPKDVEKIKKGLIKLSAKLGKLTFLQKNVDEIENHFNLENYLKGTGVTEADIDFLFKLTDDFPQLKLYGGFASKKNIKIKDIDARILVEEKEILKTIDNLTKKKFCQLPATNKFFYKLTLTLPDSKLELDLTLGRIDGENQYKGNALILPDVIDQLSLSRIPINDAKHISVCMGFRRYFVFEKHKFSLDSDYAHKHPNKFWAFAYEDDALQKEKPKGYLNVLVKQIEKKRTNKTLDEKQLMISTMKPSLSDPKVGLYSWAAIKYQWVEPHVGIFAKKMASSFNQDRLDCYFEMHCLIKEREGWANNKDIEPFINSFFDHLINNHKERKGFFNITPTNIVREEIISILKILYSTDGISYPKKDYNIVVQQFNFIVDQVILYRKNKPSGDFLNEALISQCISPIKNNSYLDEKPNTPRISDSPSTPPLPYSSSFSYSNNNVGMYGPINEGTRAKSDLSHVNRPLKNKNFHP